MLSKGVEEGFSSFSKWVLELNADEFRSLRRVSILGRGCRAEEELRRESRDVDG